jgi:hypothetical protein
VSTDNVSATGKALSGTAKVSLGNESAQANLTVGKAQVSVDGNANVKADASIGSASIRLNEGKGFASIDDKAKVSVGAQFGAVKAEVSAKLDKAVNFLGAAAAAIGTMITPEIQKPEEVK